jgi:hypothetical protein
MAVSRQGILDFDWFANPWVAKWNVGLALADDSREIGTGNQVG